MAHGGNKRLLDFFEAYGLTDGGLEKYYTKAAEHYRKALKAEVEGQPSTMNYPSPDEGREYHIEPVREPRRRIDEFEAYEWQSQEQKPVGFLKSASNFLSSTVTRAGELASSAASRVKEQHILEKVKSTATSVIQKTKKASSSLFGSSRVRTTQETRDTDESPRAGPNLSGQPPRRSGSPSGYPTSSYSLEDSIFQPRSFSQTDPQPCQANKSQSRDSKFDLWTESSF